jgi:hypothetical protein
MKPVSIMERKPSRRTNCEIKLKRLPTGTLVLMLLLSAMTATRFSILTRANPIPYPVIMMPEEYINATISLVDGKLVAKVDGAYPFSNFGYNSVRMHYPVPKRATGIYAKMNETWLDWVNSSQTYPTVIGDWPMINWTLSPVPDYFTIETRYEHHIPMISGNDTFLYAMGTGRYIGTYSKQTIAYVNVRIEANHTNLNVYTIGLENDKWIWKPANYTTTEENSTEIITLKVVSNLFYPLVEDLLITFDTKKTTDFNHNGAIDISDITVVTAVFGKRAGDADWNPMADLNNDEIINIVDVTLIAKEYGKTL